MGRFVKNLDQSLWIYSQILPFIRGRNKKNGNEHIMQCPFCNESETSHKRNAMRGYYYIDNQTYYCFRCDKWATALELYEQLSGLSKDDLIPEYMSFVRKNTTDKRGINYSNFMTLSGGNQRHEEDKIEFEYNAVPKNLKNPLTERGKKYLEKRRIFESQNLPKYAKFYSSFFKKKYEVVTIPWYMEGQECYYQWRFLDNDIPFSKYGFPKGLTKKIYGIDMIDASFPYIICTEGVFDSLWIKNGIALGGKVLTEFQKELLEERFPKHKIVYAFDNDDAGIKAMMKQSSDNPNSLVFYWKPFSGGAKDLNDFAVSYDKDFFFNVDNVMKCICSPLQLKWKLLKKLDN